jgi:hypothetical protein
MCDVWTSKDGIEWDMVVEAPWPRRSAHAAVVFKGRVVVLGGYQEDFSPSCRLSDVWAGGGAEGDDLSDWDMLTAQGSWSGRCSHCVVVLNGQIFVLGGRSDVGRLNDVHASADGSEWHVVTSSAAWAPRSSFGSFVLGGFMYVVGGVSTDNDRFYNDVYRSVDGATWEAVCVSSPWSGRKCFSAVAAAVPLDDDGRGGGRKKVSTATEADIVARLTDYVPSGDGGEEGSVVGAAAGAVEGSATAGSVDGGGDPNETKEELILAESKDEVVAAGAAAAAVDSSSNDNGSGDLDQISSASVADALAPPPPLPPPPPPTWSPPFALIIGGSDGRSAPLNDVFRFNELSEAERPKWAAILRDLRGAAASWDARVMDTELVQLANEMMERQGMHLWSLDGAAVLRAARGEALRHVCPHLQEGPQASSVLLFARLLLLRRLNEMAEALLPLIDLRMSPSGVARSPAQALWVALGGSASPDGHGPPIAVPLRRAGVLRGAVAPPRWSRLALGSRLCAHRHLLLTQVKRDYLRRVLRDTSDGGAQDWMIKKRDIKLNRWLANAQTRETDPTGHHTVFRQALRQLHTLGWSVCLSGHRPWTAVFEGEAGDDAGGPFRSSLTCMVDELMKMGVPLFVQSPNNVGRSGPRQDALVPAYTDLAGRPDITAMYEFVGRLIGVGLRQNIVLPLRLPPTVWKRLVGEEVTLRDVEAIDASAVKLLHVLADNVALTMARWEERVRRAQPNERAERVGGGGIGGGGGGENTDANSFGTSSPSAKSSPTSSPSSFSHPPPPPPSFESLCGALGCSTFTTKLSTGEVVALVPGGADRRVRSLQDVASFIALAAEARLGEGVAATQAITAGLGSVVPLPVLHLFTWRELEREVCGTVDVDMVLLKRNSRFHFGTPAFKAMFWDVLESLDGRQQGLFLRFCWARDRLPLTDDGFDNMMTVKELRRNDPDNALPQASTCFFALSLPRYSSRAVMRRQLVTAIENCSAYDLDGRAEGVRLEDLMGGGVGGVGGAGVGDEDDDAGSDG